MKSWLLTRDHTFVECKILQENRTTRKVKVIEKGTPWSGKSIVIHQEGVRRGKTYPRLFKSDTKPIDMFKYRSRVLVKLTDNKYLVPKEESYQFQPPTRYLIDSIHAEDKILLVGEAGTGKTSMIEQLAARINQPVIRVNLNGETRIADFLGRLSVVAGERGSVTKWIDGILPTAMKNGYWLIMDEIDMAEPNILSLLHPVLEPNGRLLLKENEGEEIFPHSNFRIFGTANSIGSMASRMDAYSGTNTMNEAFLDRWHILTIPSMEEKIEIEVIHKKIPGLTKKRARQIVQFANSVRSTMKDDVTSLSTFSTRRCLQWAAKMAYYRDPIESAELVFLNKVIPEDRDVLVKHVELIFGVTAKKVRKGKRKGPAVPIV